MSDESQFTYSFSLGSQTGSESQRRPAASPGPAGQPAGGPGAEAALYAVDDYDSLEVAGGMLLVGKTTGAQMLVMPEVAMVLPHCTTFRSLREHAQHLVTVFPQLGGNVDDALRVLSLVRDSGLLVSAEQICRQVNAEASDRSLERSKGFIITCDRPEAVERLLETMLAHANLAQQECLYLIDDSRDQQNAARNREAVERFNLASPTTLHYIGDETQRELVDALQRAVPAAEEAIQFLLGRDFWRGQATYGRARTLCLLLSVGSRCVVMDDDVICRALNRLEKTEGVDFGDGMRQARFFSDARQWQQQWAAAGFDPLSGHARCLGMSLTQSLRELGVSALEPGHLRGTSLTPFRDVSGAAPVLVTQSGTLGDPGTVNNAWLSKLRPDDVRQMLASPNGLELALATRQCWLGHGRPTVSKRAAMSQVTGLDNREPLPPYFPALRGEDQLFGAMLDFLFPDSVVLDYAWAVPHLPLEQRVGNAGGDSVVPRGGLHLVADYLQGVKPAGATLDYARRLESLATRLQELAELPDDQLLGRFRSGLTRTQALALQTLNDRLADTGGLDDSWKQYLETQARACVAALQQAGRPEDNAAVPDGLSPQEVLELIRRGAGGFAAALRVWPQLREAAREFRV